MPTLASLAAASEKLRLFSGATVETIVVDNNSTDSTATVALANGATVIHEPVQGISRARNTGARHATGDVLVFIDADVCVPKSLLGTIYSAMSDPACIGGGADVEYRPERKSVRLYLQCWRLLAQRLGMVQGATQFCRKDVFKRIGGYDETVWIGEDVDFYWSMSRYARRTGDKVRLIRKPRLQASTMRFDKWPFWKTLVGTNPLLIPLLRRRKWAWGGWYSRPVR